LKVLIVTPWFPSGSSPFSGAFVAEQARALARIHDVRVLVPAVILDGAERYRKVSIVDGYAVVHAGVPARRLFHQIDYSTVIAREAKEHGSAVIHAHVTVPAGFSAVLAGRFSGVPVVITEHRGPFTALFSTPRDKTKIRFALNRASAVIAVSSTLASEMKRTAEITRDIRVIPNVVDTERFRPVVNSSNGGGTARTFRLVFTGRVDDENKNLAALLRALKVLNDQSASGYRLRVIGEQSADRRSEKVARDLGVDGSCDFLGPLGGDDLARELAASDVFVLPSRLETFGVVAAEALASGKPVVATRCGGPEDFVNDETGKLVAADDDLALATAISDVCRDLSAYSAAGLAAYAKAKFGFDAVVNQLTQVYESSAN